MMSQWAQYPRRGAPQYSTGHKIPASQQTVCHRNGQRGTAPARACPSGPAFRARRWTRPLNPGMAKTRPTPPHMLQRMSHQRCHCAPWLVHSSRPPKPVVCQLTSAVRTPPAENGAVKKNVQPGQIREPRLHELSGFPESWPKHRLPRPRSLRSPSARPCHADPSSGDRQCRPDPAMSGSGHSVAQRNPVRASPNDRPFHIGHTGLPPALSRPHPDPCRCRAPYLPRRHSPPRE
jgi:hypothetical protein